MAQREISHGPPSVINAGLFKTGTASMAEAYKILGLRPHHGLDLMDLPEHWEQLERAAEGAWPDAPGARPHAPFTREDWDKIFGDYDAITDVGSTFAEQLAAAYPDAKVVVVERDADKWLASFESQIIDAIWSPLGYVMHYTVIPLLGNRGLDAMKKILLGYWGVKDTKGLRENAKVRYAEYYARIREIVPPERRLEYKLGDGWAPLCEFLSKPVPDAEFPWVNEKTAHTAKQHEQAREMLSKAFGIPGRWIGRAFGL